MKTSILMNILNVVGNAIFIYGFGIGTFGAAVSIGSMWIFRSIFFVIRFKSGKWEKGEEKI